MSHDNHSAVLTISRATSISRASKRGSTASRNQSLIRKNVAPQDLRPSDVLIERFVAWKAIVKQLIAYFEGIADIENNTARELTKLGAVIQVPFRAGNQFLGEGGLQDVYYNIRDKTRVIADHHANLGRTIDGSIVQHLVKLRAEIKAHIKNIQNDTGRLAINVAKERELSTRLISELSTAITLAKNAPMNITGKTDPYVVNQAVARQLHKQVHEENLLQKSIIIMQQNSAHFEEGIVRALQSAWQTFEEWQSRTSLAIQDTFSTLSMHFAALNPDNEWISFAARCDHLLDPATPLRDPTHISYPSKNDPSVIAVHTGHLERKKRFTRRYRESYFVLTPAGFLHEYASSDPASHEGQTPAFSLFLPMCTLGPPAPVGSRSHKFHIEERKDGTGTTKSGGLTGSILRIAGRGGVAMGHKGGSGRAWSFRARSREEMMEWWNDLRMLCARFLVASDQIDRTGPVAAVVRSAGYPSESEEDEEEDERSSVEEDPEVGDSEGEDDTYEDASTELPAYAHNGTNGNGYKLEKANHHSSIGLAPGTNVDGLPPTNGVSRRPSRRQQEKAPEGRPPRVEPRADSPMASGSSGERIGGGEVHDVDQNTVFDNVLENGQGLTGTDHAQNHALHSES